MTEILQEIATKQAVASYTTTNTSCSLREKRSSYMQHLYPATGSHGLERKPVVTSQGTMTKRTTLFIVTRGSSYTAEHAQRPKVTTTHRDEHGEPPQLLTVSVQRTRSSAREQTDRSTPPSTPVLHQKQTLRLGSPSQPREFSSKLNHSLTGTFQWSPAPHHPKR